VTATDTQNNDHNADGDYTGDDDTATAYIAEADLKLVKDAIGGKGPHTDAVAESMRRLNQKTNGQPTATLHALPTS